MEILIVDNGTSYLPQLINLLSDHTFRVVRYSKVTGVDTDNFDTVVLSGGHDFPVNGNEKRFQDEISIVKDSKKPLFGICLGFEIIAHALGAQLELMQNKERGILDIQVVEQDEIFLNITNFKVFENHRWTVKEPVSEIKVLAHSVDGIEAFKHKKRPIYAVQFHPEMFVEKSCGDEIFYNFLNSIK